MFGTASPSGKEVPMRWVRVDMSGLRLGVLAGDDAVPKENAVRVSGLTDV
jgi:hypothetical protein